MFETAHHKGRLGVAYIVCGIVSLLLPFRIQAIGTLVNDGAFQVAPTDLKALVIWDGKTETLVASEGFMYNPLVVWHLSYLLSVPSRPQTDRLRDDVFTELEKRTRKTFTKDAWWKYVLFPDVSEEKSSPAQTVTPIAYLKGVATVWPPPHMGAPGIFTMLKEKDRLLPKSAGPVLDDISKKNWHLIFQNIDSLHIESDSTDAFTISGAHTQPIKITFSNAKPLLPLRLMGVTPDRDSVRVPLSSYGSSSRDILGVTDPVLDAQISTPSSNQYPPLLTDFSNIKLEVYVISDRKYSAPGFTTVFADWVNPEDVTIRNGKKDPYWKLPKGKLFLTRMFRYVPQIQLEDYELIPDPSNSRVNANVSLTKEPIRIVLPIVLIGLIGIFIGKKIHGSS
jgi:hypothetical protein